MSSMSKVSVQRMSEWLLSRLWEMWDQSNKFLINILCIEWKGFEEIILKSSEEIHSKNLTQPVIQGVILSTQGSHKISVMNDLTQVLLTKEKLKLTKGSNTNSHESRNSGKAERNTTVFF